MTTAAATTGSLLRHPPSLCLFSTPPPLVCARMPSRTATLRASRRRSISCQVAVTTEHLSPSSAAGEGSDPESKVGSRIRVKVPLKVYHFGKAPELDLNGMEGVIKQYVGVWKGKRVSANLPFKAEFLVSVDGQEKPVKFFAHLKDDEFEYLWTD